MSLKVNRKMGGEKLIITLSGGRDEAAP